MKKLTSIIAISLISLGTAFAQTATPVKAKQSVKTNVVVKTEVKQVVKKTTTVVAGPTKKDGTADMRYKVNKTVKVAGPTKKDGTADMRYKANKEVKKKTN